MTQLTCFFLSGIGYNFLFSHCKTISCDWLITHARFNDDASGQLRRFSGQYLDVNTKVINGLHLIKIAFQHINKCNNAQVRHRRQRTEKANTHKIPNKLLMKMRGSLSDSSIDLLQSQWTSIKDNCYKYLTLYTEMRS